MIGFANARDEFENVAERNDSLLPPYVCIVVRRERRPLSRFSFFVSALRAVAWRVNRDSGTLISPSSMR